MGASLRHRLNAVVRFVRWHRRWRRLIVDPDVANELRVRFWERVAFVPEQVVDDEDGRAPYWVMSWPYGDECRP